MLVPDLTFVSSVKLMCNVLLLRTNVNTTPTLMGVFYCCRYYGMTPKEEAAHVRQVKRFAKGLFANVLGDADR